jgi:hypothetical protein
MGNHITFLSQPHLALSIGASTNSDDYKTINVVTFEEQRVLIGSVVVSINFNEL